MLNLFARFTFAALICSMTIENALADDIIPCRSGLKSDTYQLEIDKNTCRDLCPNTICGGNPAIMSTNIFTEIDKYEITCRCLSPQGGGGGSSGGSSDTKSCTGTCRIQYGGNYPNTVDEPVSYASSISELQANCQEFCGASRDAVSCTLINSSCR